MTHPQPLRSVYTSNLPDIFRQLNISLILSTYQAGRVIPVRHDAADANAPGSTGGINTHFRLFDKPMGVSAKDDRLVIGGRNTVWEYRNVPAAAQALAPTGKHVACDSLWWASGLSGGKLRAIVKDSKAGTTVGLSSYDRLISI